jgi:hypothetical protein
MAGYRTGKILFCFIVLISTATLCYGQEATPTGNQAESLIELLKDKGVITEEEAQALKQRAEEQPSAEIIQEGTSQEKTPVELEEELQEVKQKQEQLEIQTEDALRRSRLLEREVKRIDEQKIEEIKQKQYKASWAERIKLGGDLRLRWQADYFDPDNDPQNEGGSATEPLNTTEDRKQWRYRARLSLDATILDPREVNVGKAKIGLRLTTGNEKNPVSTNETLGDYFNKDGLVFDRAYLQWNWKPEDVWWGNKIPEFGLTGGRLPNPWFYTDLVWDNDLNFEGVVFNFKTDTLMENTWSGFITTGAFPLKEVETKSDQWLYGGQIGIEHRPRYGITYKLGGAYYFYKNVQGVPLTDPLQIFEPDFDASVPLYRQKGNAEYNLNPFATSPDEVILGLASEFELLNVTAQIDLAFFFPVHVIFWGDYVKNLGFDQEEVRQLTDDPSYPDTSQGYHLGALVGYPRMVDFGNWNVSLAYKYLEPDSVFDAFTDSDFGLGGTNCKGYTLSGMFGLYRDIWLQARWLSSNEIFGREEGFPKLAVDTLQIDINGRF